MWLRLVLRLPIDSFSPGIDSKELRRIPERQERETNKVGYELSDALVDMHRCGGGDRRV